MSTLQGEAAEALWIEDRIKTGWLVAGKERTPIAWENVAFDPPNPPRAWIRVTIAGAGADQTELSETSPRYRHDGVVIVEVFTPAGKGTGENRRLCDLVAALFRGVTGPGIRFRPPYGVPQGRAAARVENVDAWYKRDVMCPFTRDTKF